MYVHFVDGQHLTFSRTAHITIYVTIDHICRPCTYVHFTVFQFKTDFAPETFLLLSIKHWQFLLRTQI